MNNLVVIISEKGSTSDVVVYCWYNTNTFTWIMHYTEYSRKNNDIYTNTLKKSHKDFIKILHDIKKETPNAKINYIKYNMEGVKHV